MHYTRARRTGCGGLIARVILVAMLGVVALICVANRSWIEGKALNAVYGGRPKIHSGEYFTPGASADEDGVRQTAVLVDGHPRVRVTSPTAAWRRHHKDAACRDGVCTAAATPGSFAGRGGVDIVGIGAGLLVLYIAWVLFFDNGGASRGNSRYGRYER